MNRHVSVLQQNKRQNESWQKNYRFCLICMLIGILLGGIPLATIVTLYIKDSNNHTSSITTTIPNIIPTLRWNPVGITVAGVSNQPGTASNKLNIPIGIALDYSNSLYIADFGNNRTQKYQRDATFGRTVAGQANGTASNSSACISNPTDVTIDTNNNVYVLDTRNNRVQFWSDGSLSGVTLAGTGVAGTSNSQLNTPYGIARDPDSSTLYIADTVNNRVMRYLSGTMSGTIAARTGIFGSSNTQLSAPYGIYLDLPTNSLLIANGARNNIVRWILGASNWTLVAGNSNGTSGSSSTNLMAPVDVTVDPMGNIYVADAYNHRIQFFPVGQLNGITIAGINCTQGTNATQLNTPFSVALDNQLNLYVSDAYNHRIQKFLRY